MRNLRIQAVSLIVRPRAVVVCVLLALVLVAGFCASLMIGDLPLTVPEFFDALVGAGDPSVLFVFYELRLPRVLVAVLVGAAFGMAGAIFQSVTRNPLASPDIIGVSQGASAAAVAGLLFGFAGASVPVLALVGAFVAAATIYLLAWQRGTTGYRIVLVGIGVWALCTSLINFMLVQTDADQAQGVASWLIGNLTARGWDHVQPLSIACAVLLPAGLMLGRTLNALRLGDDTALGLGVPVQRARLLVLAVAVALVAFGTAAAGPIAFVALIAPQVAMRLVRIPGPPVLPAALVGALMVLLADLAAQHVLPGTELPAGVVTGVLGGPYLLLLLARSNRTGSD